MLEERDYNLVSAVMDLGDDLAKKLNQTSAHTVIAGALSGSGHIYFGVNCDGIHGTCAEIVAYANAVLAMDSNIETFVAVLINHSNGERIVPPCGNCRQILSELAPRSFVVLSDQKGLEKVPISALLPCPYQH